MVAPAWRFAPAEQAAIGQEELPDCLGQSQVFIYPGTWGNSGGGVG